MKDGISGAYGGSAGERYIVGVDISVVKLDRKRPLGEPRGKW
jgi:hypothetical protein